MMRQRNVSRLFVVSAMTAGALVAVSAATSQAHGRAGNVYLLTNQSSGNAVMVYHRDAGGALTPTGSYATGGNGAGTGADPLASQGALVLSDDERFLFAVNAGSNSVSVFATAGDQLTLLDVVDSGGTRPVSVDVRHNLVYVLNAGGTPNITGFQIHGRSNRLTALAGSTRNLPGGTSAAPAEVAFSREGDVLVVTEKGTNSLDTFTLEDGIPGTGATFSSTGATPFGFAFGHDNVAVVSNAGSGPGTASVSSYSVDDDGNVSPITPALADTQTAACWLVVPTNGRFAYTANAGTATISSYGVAADGSLTLLDAVAAATAPGSVPTDMALTGNSRFIYVRDGGKNSITGFQVGPQGGLTLVGTVLGLPAGAQGIAAR
jgi:6-phosphogluconolactonase